MHRPSFQGFMEVVLIGPPSLVHFASPCRGQRVVDLSGMHLTSLSGRQKPSALAAPVCNNSSWATPARRLRIGRERRMAGVPERGTARSGAENTMAMPADEQFLEAWCFRQACHEKVLGIKVDSCISTSWVGRGLRWGGNDCAAPPVLTCAGLPVRAMQPVAGECGGGEDRRQIVYSPSEARMPPATSSHTGYCPGFCSAPSCRATSAGVGSMVAC